MKLEAFKQNKKLKKTLITLIAILVVAGGAVILYRTYALYQEEHKYNVIKGIVPNFGSDIELAYTINGQISNEGFPKKGRTYDASKVTCDNGVTAHWDNNVWSLALDNTNNQLKIKCTVDFKPATLLAKKAVDTQYVSMTPTNSEYFVYDGETGYDQSQWLNPSELNLWRIIKINDDGTIEMVSAYTSSKEVCFKGKVGYSNYAGTLNRIAAAYTNEKYVESTRHIGYNGQVEYINVKYFGQTFNLYEYYYNDYGMNYFPQSDYNRLGMYYDKLYEADFEMMRDNFFPYVTCVNSKTDDECPFFIPSRMEDSGSGLYDADFYGFYYHPGNVERGEMFKLFETHDEYDTDLVEYEFCSHILPVVVLKSGLSISGGSGTINDPWRLSN